MEREIKEQIKEKESWLRGKPTKFTKLLCKIFGHSLAVVGTWGSDETLFCRWCGRDIKKITFNPK